MGKVKECKICGTLVDHTACNEDRGIFTLITDSDEEGTRHERYDLCASCAYKVQIYILSKQLGR